MGKMMRKMMVALSFSVLAFGSGCPSSVKETRCDATNCMGCCNSSGVRRCGCGAS